MPLKSFIYQKIKTRKKEQFSTCNQFAPIPLASHSPFSVAWIFHIFIPVAVAVRGPQPPALPPIRTSECHAPIVLPPILLRFLVRCPIFYFSLFCSSYIFLSFFSALLYIIAWEKFLGSRCQSIFKAKQHSDHVFPPLWICLFGFCLSTMEIWHPPPRTGGMNVSFSLQFASLSVFEGGQDRTGQASSLSSLFFREEPPSKGIPPIMFSLPKSKLTLLFEGNVHCCQFFEDFPSYLWLIFVGAM